MVASVINIDVSWAHCVLLVGVCDDLEAMKRVGWLAGWSGGGGGMGKWVGGPNLCNRKERITQNKTLPTFLHIATHAEISSYINYIIIAI